MVSHIDISSRRRAEEESRRQRHELAHALRLTTLGQLVRALVSSPPWLLTKEADGSLADDLVY